MIVLKPPVDPSYDYDYLVHCLEVWKGIEESAPWMGTGYAACAPVHRLSVSSRQWDTEVDVVDNELEKSTALIMGECMDRLEAVERCLIMYAHCGTNSRWVQDMQPERAQARYEAALLRFALSARNSGVDV